MGIPVPMMMMMIIIMIIIIIIIIITENKKEQVEQEAKMATYRHREQVFFKGTELYGNRTYMNKVG